MNRVLFDKISANVLYPGIELGLKRLILEKEELNKKMAEMGKNIEGGGPRIETPLDEALIKAYNKNASRRLLFTAALLAVEARLEIELEFDFAGELLGLVKESKKLVKP